jgi:hypothetical protein
MHLSSQSLTASEKRSPLEYFHGLYIVDAAGFGGAATFSWFSDDTEALAHLRHRLVHLYLDVDVEADDSGAAVFAVGEALNGAQSLDAISLDAVNAALKGLCEIRWAGSLDDLRAGDKPFERGIQADYSENIFGDERGFSGSDWDDFAHHLTHYHG